MLALEYTLVGRAHGLPRNALRMGVVLDRALNALLMHHVPSARGRSDAAGTGRHFHIHVAQGARSWIAEFPVAGLASNRGQICLWVGNQTTSDLSS
jgi:hypothetical protein